MEIKGDFLGFTFAGVRSEDLGFCRTSDGDRYEESLQPDVRDNTAEVPGMDGEYFFGSNYEPKQIEINIAFDSMTEEQFRRFQRHFGRKQQGELIFDERPYKKYLAKIESPIELSFVCFDEPYKTVQEARDGVRVANRRTETVEVDGEEVETIVVEREQVTPYSIDYTRTRRIYKGEGTISFVCYYPFAKSVFKVLPSKALYANVDDWAVSSGLLSAEQYSQVDTYDDGVFHVYNAGDLPTGFRLYCPFNSHSYDSLVLQYKEYLGDPTEDVGLQLSNVVPATGDIGFLINTENCLIQGVSNISYTQAGETIITTSGNLYNQYITQGHFFKLQPNLYLEEDATIQVLGGNEDMQIFYDYLYF